MLGIGGRFAALKGMVAVPNLAGLSRSAAQTAIESAGLVYGGSSDTTINDISLDDKIANQSIVANTLVDYETSVSVTRYRYEASGGTPSYPPKPADDGQIILGDCLLDGGATQYPADEAYCGTGDDITTRIEPGYQIFKRIDKRVSYTEGPSFTWTRVETPLPAEECYRIFQGNRRTQNSPLCVVCTTIVDTITYSGRNTGCATGFSNYRTDIYPEGCDPADRTVALGCISDPNPAEVTLVNTSFGDCTEADQDTLAGAPGATIGIPCYFEGGGIRTRTRTYSDGSIVNDTVCCEYIPPDPVCTPSTETGAWSSCNSGTQNRTVTTTSANCSVTTTTQTQSCVTAGCGAYSAWSPACGDPGTQQTRSASCINDQGVGYTDTQTQCCTGISRTYGPCTGGIRKFQSVTTTTYFSNCTSSTVTRNEECLAFL
jgi:hypothetical protein